jgi:hypothetical protein
VSHGVSLEVLVDSFTVDGYNLSPAVKKFKTSALFRYNDFFGRLLQFPKQFSIIRHLCSPQAWRGKEE